LVVTLITFNEERNLPRVLDSLGDLADEIIVVDSGSTDRTLEIAVERRARVFTRAWTGFADQRNFAAAQAPSDWVLALDADEELSPELRQSIQEWKSRPPAAAAYEFSRLASYLGSWIRHSGWYPDRKVRLYRRDLGRFHGAAHDSLTAEGRVERLNGDLLHHAYRTLAEHEAKVNSYSTAVARELYDRGRRSWLPAMLLATPWTLVRKFIIQRGFLDGKRGWRIAWHSTRYTYLKFRKLGKLVRGETLAGAPQVNIRT
jgi:glycosyltransferase involved in cell wall biosynthesis